MLCRPKGLGRFMSQEKQTVVKEACKQRFPSCPSWLKREEEMFESGLGSMGIVLIRKLDWRKKKTRNLESSENSSSLCVHSAKKSDKGRSHGTTGMAASWWMSGRSHKWQEVVGFLRKSRLSLFFCFILGNVHLDCHSLKNI